MKRREALIVAASCAGLLTVAARVYAQPWGKWLGSGGWGPGGAYQRHYNPESAFSTAGEIESIQTFVPAPGTLPGVRFFLKTAGETIDVHLGPLWYIERLDLKLEPGDHVELRGSRVTIDGKPIVIAAEIRKGDADLVLRDAKGVPVWAGWRRRR
jgi:hypothetical protein